MPEDELVVRTSRQLGRAVDEYVARVVARGPVSPRVGAEFVGRLVQRTAGELGQSVADFIARTVDRARAAPPVDDAVNSMAARLVLAPGAITGVMERAKSRFDLTAREADVLTASLCGVPRRHLAGILGVSENTIKTTVRHAIGKTGHRNLDDAVWWLRERSVRGR